LKVAKSLDKVKSGKAFPKVLEVTKRNHPGTFV